MLRCFLRSLLSEGGRFWGGGGMGVEKIRNEVYNSFYDANTYFSMVVYFPVEEERNENVIIHWS